MAAFVGPRGSQRNAPTKQRPALSSESNKENLPFEKQPTRKENHAERMDVSPQGKSEIKSKNLSQVTLVASRRRRGSNIDRISEGVDKILWLRAKILK